MPVKIIFTLALFAASITSLSRIDPPGWIIVLTPDLTKFLIPSAKGKNPSDAATAFFNFFKKEGEF